MKKKINSQKEEQEPFLKFMVSKNQKERLLIFSAFYIILYILITWLYPYPASISDSGGYVRAALTNSMDTYRPFGYSQFLIYIHGLSESIHFLVFMQYIINAAATLFLVFSVSYFFKPGTRSIYYLYAFFAIFSPVSIYLSNSVLSDSLFTSLTIFWASCGLWMIFSNNKYVKLIFWFVHLLLLFYLINIRYTGLVYVPITLLFIYFSFFHRNIYRWIILSVIPLLVVFGYYSNQKAKTYRLIHVKTFSGFGGWQLANNALHCLPYIKLNPAEIREEPVRRFAKYALRFDTLLVLNVKPTAKFMWDAKLPLKMYCVSEASRTNTSYLFQWNYLGENVYSRFGTHIMKKYPFSFARHYLLPNCRLVLYPDQDQVVKKFRDDGIPAELLQQWFAFRKGEEVYNRSRVFEKTFHLIPFSRLVLWVIFFSTVVIFLFMRDKIQWQASKKYMYWSLLSFIMIYFAFSAYAGPFELRYIAPVHLILISLIYIVLNSLLPVSENKK